MAYDVLAESVALIESRHVDPVRRLTRRRRFAAMAVDVADDMAATMFARRGARAVLQETHVLVLRDGRWRLLGGGGATSDDYLLADRPAVLPDYLRLGDAATAAESPVMAINGSGGVRDGGDEPDRPPERGRWISHADVRVSARVTSVQVSDKWLPVLWHGHVLVVWSGQQPPRVVARDEDGRELGALTLPSPR